MVGWASSAALAQPHDARTMIVLRGTMIAVGCSLPDRARYVLVGREQGEHMAMINLVDVSFSRLGTPMHMSSWDQFFFTLPAIPYYHRVNSISSYEEFFQAFLQEFDHYPTRLNFSSWPCLVCTRSSAIQPFGYHLLL